MTQPSTRILVLGAGIAGLLFTLRLAGKVARESVQITLIDELDTFIVRPRLHEFATSQHRITVQVEQEQQQELEYDYLVYALGSMTDRQNMPGVAQYAYSLSARGPFSASALRERLPEIGASAWPALSGGGC